MPLPRTALTIKGGCNCGAIRYTISIPPGPQRPAHPSSTPSDPVALPFVCTDHCNDCRRATGSILPAWICTPISMITCSLLPRPGSQDQAAAKVPAEQAFTPGPIADNSFLTFYLSSEGRRRSFCGKCGTNLGYVAFPMPEGWPDMLDVTLGTVDREFLDDSEGALIPERQLWWGCGLGWVKGLSCEGLGGLPRHLDYKVDEHVKGD